MSLANFKILKFLGKGSYGSVHKVLRTIDGNEYALKEVDIRNMSQKEREEAVNEIRILASIADNNVVRYHESFCENEKLYIVTEFASSGDLLSLIKKQKSKNRFFDEEQVWSFFIQLCLGLRALHNRHILHRDLKSPNILMASETTLKIGDLGVAKLLKSRDKLTKTQVGTPYYVSPEVWRNQAYDVKCDIWSLGVLLYELITFKRPFEADNMKQLVSKVLAGKYTPIPPTWSRELQDMVRRMLIQDPSQRPTVNDILAMPAVARRLASMNENMFAGSSSSADAQAAGGAGGLPVGGGVAAVRGILNDVSNVRIRSTIKVPRNLSHMHFPTPCYPAMKPKSRVRESASKLIASYKQKYQQGAPTGATKKGLAGPSGSAGPSDAQPVRLPVLSGGSTPEKRPAAGGMNPCPPPASYADQGAPRRPGMPAQRLPYIQDNRQQQPQPPAMPPSGRRPAAPLSAAHAAPAGAHQQQQQGMMNQQQQAAKPPMVPQAPLPAYRRPIRY